MQKNKQAPDGARESTPRFPRPIRGFWLFRDLFQGLRSLRSLTPGYHLSAPPGLRINCRSYLMHYGRDTTTKAELYATAGVLDYWVLDLTNRLLHVFRDPQSLPLPTEFSTIAYRTHDTLGPNDTIAPLALPSGTIRVANLLP